MMLSSHLILCCALLLLSPVPPSIRVFSNESILRNKDFFFFYVNKRASSIPLSFYPLFIFNRINNPQSIFLSSDVTLKYSLRLHFLLLYPISLANSTVRTILHLDCKQPKSKKHKSSCPFRNQFLWVIPEKGLCITAPLKHNDLQMPPSLKGNIFNWRK